MAGVWDGAVVEHVVRESLCEELPLEESLMWKETSQVKTVLGNGMAAGTKAPRRTGFVRLKERASGKFSDSNHDTHLDEAFPHSSYLRGLLSSEWRLEALCLSFSHHAFLQ